MNGPLAALAEAFPGISRRDEALGARTSLGVGGGAALLLVPPDAETACRAWRAAHDLGTRPRVLGGGTNLLVPEGTLDDPVISTAGLSGCETEGTTIRAGAGLGLAALLDRAAEAGLSGLEALAGIPGTVGGALVMNAGGRRGAIGGAVAAVTVCGPAGPVERGAREIEFRYRESSLAGSLVLAARFDLTRADPGAVRLAVDEERAYRRRTQPRGRTAGCCFRNPPGGVAGRLIEEAGLKGAAIGGASVSTVHANFMVVDQGATAADVRALVARVRETVQGRTGIALETEIVIW